MIDSLFADIFSVTELLAQESQNLGQALPPPSIGRMLFDMLPMLALVWLIFYFMVIRPHETKSKAQQKMISELKRGDTVSTQAGIIGKVVSVEDDHVLVEVANNVKIKFERSKVLKKIDQNESKADTKSKAA